MKQYTSVLSTDQLIQLGREILRDEHLRNLNSLAKSHELYNSDVYHRQGGTPNWNRQEMIELIASCNGGTAPDDIVRKRDAARTATAAPKPTHAPPTSAPVGPPKRRVAVFVACATCGKDVAVPEDKADSQVFCGVSCQDKFSSTKNTLLTEGAKFLELVGSRYYDCDQNSKLLMDYLLSKRQTLTADNLLEAFLAVRSQLLQPLTIHDIQGMTADQLEARRRIDPDLGGADLAGLRKYQTKTGGVN